MPVLLALVAVAGAAVAVAGPGLVLRFLGCLAVALVGVVLATGRRA